MTTWFTSDLHLGHARVIEFCKRPFSYADEMDDAIIKNYNNSIKDSDLVYFLGDISFHKPRIGIPLLKRLKGKKILIRGNHDKYSVTQYLESGFMIVLEEAKIKLLGHYLLLSHYPYKPENSEIDPKMLRYLDRRPINKGGSWLLHGHVHEKWKQKGKQINVGVDQWDFKPVSEKIILSRLSDNSD